ncbi:hypothetical protein DFH08DRAFT_948250 [Mycena albidolilacea]|uniref:Uncharacterized protein n=1 Tax=Mycena albidolilacea TaxID=1033008 RepID=A0AAD7AQL5_9AGAR|nr:hypothetical protein DFH08DRAFT_948250 [Mycena albidolilacea]
MASVTPFNAAATLGAFEISALVSYVLLGLAITQTYIYYRRFPDDSLKIKALVAFVCLSEVAHAICLGHALYALTISDYGQPEHVFIAPRSLPALIFLSGLVAASVEAFFSFRIYVLSKKVYIPISSWIMSILCLVGASVIFSVRLDKIIHLGSRSKGLLIALWSVAAVNDLTVTTTLLVILVRERSNAYKRTVALLDKLIMYTIESGILISASSIATLICVSKFILIFKFTT